jgi:2',3'-cyclic-nucleotide 2'-phosphodiesterase (5'-nucleotidase family)
MRLNVIQKNPLRKMEMEISRSFITKLFLLSLFLGPSLCFGNETSLTLIYSSNTLGEIDPSWRGQAGYAGGLARRSHYIKKVKEEVENLLLHDDGDALVNSYFNHGQEKPKARKRAEVILEAYEKMGYDAINIGDLDFGLGIDYLRYLQRRSHIPFISANLVYGGTEKRVFEPYLIKKMGGLKVGIIGLLPSELPIHMYKELKGYAIKDAFQTAMTVMGYLTTRCDYLIALAHLTSPEIESLVDIFPRISIIIGGEDRSFSFPKEVFGSLVVQTDAFGIHIGRLDLRLRKRSWDHIDVFPTTLLRKNIEGYENVLTLLHPGMESDKEIEKLIDSSRDQLKRPLP